MSPFGQAVYLNIRDWQQSRMLLRAVFSFFSQVSCQSQNVKIMTMHYQTTDILRIHLEYCCLEHMWSFKLYDINRTTKSNGLHSKKNILLTRFLPVASFFFIPLTWNN